MLRVFVISLTVFLNTISITSSNPIEDVKFDKINDVYCNKSGVQIEYTNGEAKWINANELNSYREYDRCIEIISLDGNKYVFEKNY